MSKKPIAVLAGAILVLSSGALALGQQPATTTVKKTTTTVTQPTTTTVTQTPTTTVTQTPTTVTKTVQNPDGTFTVIEYPVGKEVKINLNPVTLTKSKGVATILRDDSGTKIVLNVTDVPADVTGINLYAVDEAGVVTFLGPVAVSNGVGTFTTTTPLNKFMLIASPEASITAYDPNTKVFFRSAVPEGFAVIPHTTNPVGENVAASTTEATAPTAVTTVAPTAVTTVAPTAVTTVAPTAVTTAVTTDATTAVTTVATTAAPTYTVPMLNIPAYKKGDDTKMKINFSGAMTGTRANVFIKPRKDGPTEVKLRFHDLKEAPAGKAFTVWAVSPDNKFVKLGQITNTPGRNEGQVQSETTLPDFGLLVTMEDAKGTLVNPLGPSIGIVEIAN